MTLYMEMLQNEQIGILIIRLSLRNKFMIDEIMNIEKNNKTTLEGFSAFSPHSNVCCLVCMQNW